MSRRAAVITQADVARAIRAARQCGAATVQISPDGTIIIALEGPASIDGVDTEQQPDHEIVM
jgi:hypothetical protein